MRWFRAAEPDFHARFDAFAVERRGGSADVDAAASAIVDAVRREGFPALRRFSAEFDRVVNNKATVRLVPDALA